VSENKKLDLSGVSFFLKLGAIGLGIGLIAAGSGGKSAAPLPLTAPHESDYDSTNEKALITFAMLQVARELDAAGWTAAAQVYRDQAAAPPAGTAARALQSVADSLDRYRMRNGPKLRALATKIDPLKPRS